MQEFEKRKLQKQGSKKEEVKKEDNKTKVKNFFSRAMQKIEDVFEPEKKQKKLDEEEAQQQFF